nr:MAG TPA: hypothetical protein [Caudoviricetes sp.]
MLFICGREVAIQISHSKRLGKDENYAQQFINSAGTHLKKRRK